MASSALITCRELSVSYGEEPVLSAVNLEVAEGDFLPLVGPNGAGKTTLLKAILGLVSPCGGAITTPFSRQPPGYVPQQGVIDPLFPIPARQIVAMGLYPKLGWWRRPGRAGRERVNQALARMGLDEHGDKTFAELSGGMRQKALIARALVADPAALILDEPTAGLDEPSQMEILAHLRRLNREEGRTVLMAHHGESLLTGTAERVCEVGRGRVRLREVNHVH